AHAEPQAEDGEEVAGPDLREVVAQECRPRLTTAAVEIAWAVLGDGAWQNRPAELAAFGGDDLLAPGRVLSPEPADQLAKVRWDWWPTGRLFRSSAPPPAPTRAMPAEEGGRLDDRDRVS